MPNLGPGNVQTLNGNQSYASAFDVTQGFALTGVDIQAAQIQFNGNFFQTVVAQIFADSAGLPSIAIGTSDAFTFSVTGPTLQEIHLAPTADLLAGSRYWLVLSVDNGGNQVNFATASSSLFPITTNATAADGLFRANGSPPSGWSSAATERTLAFNLYGSAVPEPSGFWFAAAAGLGLAGWAWRRRRTA